MIQRVQTIWMLFAALAVFLTLKFSFYSGTLINTGTTVNVEPFYKVVGTDNFIIMVLTSALGTGLMISIFLFKHRTLQLRICIFALLAEFLIIFLYVREIKRFSQGSFDLWAALHMLIILFIILATVAIYKDAKLIKDSNRLR